MLIKLRKKINLESHLSVAVGIIGLIGSLLFLSPSITGNVIGNLNSFSSNTIGIILLIMGFVGTFSFLEDLLKKSRNKNGERDDSFIHRLNMARVSRPVYYIFNEQTEYPKDEFRKNLRNTGALSKRKEESANRYRAKKFPLWLPNGKIAFYEPHKKKYTFNSPLKQRPSVYAHEFTHHLGSIAPTFNDL